MRSNLDIDAEEKNVRDDEIARNLKFGIDPRLVQLVLGLELRFGLGLELVLMDFSVWVVLGISLAWKLHCFVRRTDALRA